VRRWPKAAFLVGLLVIGIALSLYLSTLDNGLRLDELKGGDLITHQYAQAEARPSNAPGYPLYTMGGWLWFRLGRLGLSPWFSPIEILSLYSTLWALASLITLFVLIREVADDNWPIAALGTLFYSFTYFFWYYSVSTEQYTSTVFQTLIMVLWAFRWERTRRDKYLYALALMTGLCLANLVTALFILPPLLVLILTGEPRLFKRGRVIAGCVTLALLPLLSYVYVYVRGAAHPEWWGSGRWHSASEWFISFMSTQQGRDEMTWTLGPLTAEFPGLIVWEMSAIGLVLGLIGWWLLGRRRGGFLFASLVIYLAFSYIDRFGNWYQVFMPMYPLLTMGIAVTADRAWRWAGQPDTDGRSHTALGLSANLRRGGILLGLGLLVASRLVDPDPRAFQRDRPDDDGLRPGWVILADDPAPGATVIGDGDQFVSLEYLTEIWGARPDVHAARLSEAPALIKRRAQPLYFTREVAPLVLGEAGPDAELSGQGQNLIALHFVPSSDIPASAQKLSVPFGNSLRLVGYEVHERPVAAGQSNGLGDKVKKLFTHAQSDTAAGPLQQFQLSLFWQAKDRMDRDWSVSVRPTQAGEFLPSGTDIVQMDVTHPILGLYPMSRWTPGEVVRDDYVIALPADQKYDGVKVIVYRPAEGGFENLGVTDVSIERR